MKTFNSQRYPIETPWGPSQSITEIAEGIDRIDTASHGGIRVSPERYKSMPVGLRAFAPWATSPPHDDSHWYEEDSDVAIVVAAFPDYFPENWVEMARKQLEEDPYYGKAGYDPSRI